MTKVKHSHRKSAGKHWTRRAASVVGSAISTALRHKKSHSRTKTLLNSKVEKMKGDDVQKGITDATYYLKCAGNACKHVDFKSVFKYGETTSDVKDSTAGNIGAADIVGIASTCQQIVSYGTGVALGQQPEKGAVALLQLNESCKITGSAYITPPGSQFYAYDKLCVKSCKVSVAVTNLSLTDDSVWLYVCEAKCNNKSGPSTTWNTALGGVGYPFVPATVQIAAGAVTGGTIGYYTTNANYFDSPTGLEGFRKMWKVLKCHRINFSGGSTEEVNFHITTDYMVDAEKIIQQNPGITADPTTWTEPNISVVYPRGSVAIMAVQRGMPVHDITTDTAAVSRVMTYATTKVGFLVHKHYTTHPVKNNSTRIPMDTGLVQIPLNPALVKQNLVSVVDTLITNNTT